MGVNTTRTVGQRYHFSNIIGESAAIRRVFEVMERVCFTPSTVMIVGESGTGKELVARAIHSHGPRRERRFVAINCGAIAENLLESELFGYKAGAFTGAMRDKKGLFEAADEGTLFLDEVTDMSPALQVKLLRALEEGQITRVGDTEPRMVDVRIICASVRDPEREMEEGRLREELYYRLNVVTIFLPPLRERREDVPLLADYFLKLYNQKLGRTISGFSQEAMPVMMRYDWPGNVRELEHEIERALVLARDNGPLTPEVFSERVVKWTGGQPSSGESGQGGSLKDVMNNVEKRIILERLILCNWNRSKTAESLGISRYWLFQKIRKYRLEGVSQGT
jgi:Nif-specific regulatory protein